MNKKYNIVIVCGLNPNTGPGIIALDMFKKFQIDGHDVKIISNEYFEERDKKISSIANNTNKLSKLFKKFRPINIYRKFLSFFKQRVPSKFNMYSLKKQGENNYSNLVLEKIGKTPDVFIYMFSHYFITPFDLLDLFNKTKAPILFWLMDSAAMTGGCHFTWDCKRYIENCGNCPGINSNNKNDLTNKNMLRKHDVFNRIKIYPVYTGERIKQMLIESSLFKDKEIYYASTPVDKDYYTNEYRKESRKECDLPENKKLIFFAAFTVTSERKGMRILLNSLHELAKQLTKEEKENILFVIAGNDIDPIKKEIPFQYKYLGYLSHSNFSKTIRSVDIFICPSIEDYGPMVINQSLMSGTPVVAFDMGVASEIIHTGITGYRARLSDAEDLTRGIKYMLDLNYLMWQQMSDNCRALALKWSSVEKVSDDFYKIFDNILIDKS